MGERFLVELEPAGGAWSRVPAEVRLRKLLRAALRAYGLRARLVTPASPLVEEPIGDPAPAERAAGRLRACDRELRAVAREIRPTRDGETSALWVCHRLDYAAGAVIEAANALEEHGTEAVTWPEAEAARR